MENKNWLVGLIVFAVIAVVAIVGLNKANGNKQEPTQAVSGAVSENYFSDDAKVMYFYSDNCSWCQKQKEVLAKISAEGYRVKPMNVGKDTSLWQTYEVNGTPTFIAENNDRLEGYQTEDKLKPWLDAHK